jgi:protein O-GlcNAc transferase
MMTNRRTYGALGAKASSIRTLGLAHYGLLRDKAEALYRKGIRHLEAGKLEDAVQSLREAVLVFPAHASAWNDLGVVMEALENRHEAMACYRAALRVEPDNADAKSNLAMLVMAMDLERALRAQALYSQPLASRVAV